MIGIILEDSSARNTTYPNCEVWPLLEANDVSEYPVTLIEFFCKPRSLILRACSVEPLIARLVTLITVFGSSVKCSLVIRVSSDISIRQSCRVCKSHISFILTNTNSEKLQSSRSNISCFAYSIRSSCKLLVESLEIQKPVNRKGIFWSLSISNLFPVPQKLL